MPKTKFVKNTYHYCHLGYPHSYCSCSMHKKLKVVKYNKPQRTSVVAVYNTANKEHGNCI